MIISQLLLHGISAFLKLIGKIMWSETFKV